MKFQDSSFNGLKVTVGTKSVTHARTHARTHAPKAICPINFFKVGGIISDTYCILILLTPKATAQKRNKLTWGTSLDRVDSELVKRLIITLLNWRESE